MKKIVITTEKCLTETGLAGRRITKLDTLIEAEIQEKEYFGAYPYCALYFKQIDILTTDGRKTLRLNNVYEEIQFLKILGLLTECGHRLSEIRKERKRKLENWKGEETFII